MDSISIRQRLSLHQLIVMKLKDLACSMMNRSFENTALNVPDFLYNIEQNIRFKQGNRYIIWIYLRIIVYI